MICFECKLKSETIFACSACKSVHYCCRECQKKNWKEHQKQCQKPDRRHQCKSCRVFHIKFQGTKYDVNCCTNLEWESFVDSVAMMTTTSSKELKIICSGQKLTSDNYEKILQVKSILRIIQLY